MADQPDRGPRLRTVVLLLVAVVVAVLAADLLSALVPGLDDALAALPLVGAVLVGGTVVVLGGTLLRR